MEQKPRIRISAENWENGSFTPIFVNKSAFLVSAEEVNSQVKGFIDARIEVAQETLQKLEQKNTSTTSEKPEQTERPEKLQPVATSRHERLSIKGTFFSIVNGIITSITSVLGLVVSVFAYNKADQPMRIVQFVEIPAQVREYKGDSTLSVYSFASPKASDPPDFKGAIREGVKQFPEIHKTIMVAADSMSAGKDAVKTYEDLITDLTTIRNNFKVTKDKSALSKFDSLVNAFELGNYFYVADSKGPHMRIVVKK